VDLQTHHHDAEGARNLYEALIAVYREVHADDDPEFYSADRYRQQLDSHTQAWGFELVTAHLDGELVGYVYGFPLPAQARWWRGLQTPVPDEELRETGDRTFAISELMVRPPWRRQGMARSLHDELLAGRGEERATLLVRPDNAPAQAAYAKWGWHKIGEVRPSWQGAPLYDALILPLR
jgi:ribosomal protein S18 acetylase RimI-like enzyme